MLLHGEIFSREKTRKYWGPLLTISFSLLYHYGSIHLGYIFIPAWLLLFVVMGAFVGGLPSGFLSAAWAFGYSLYATDDIIWAVQVGIVALLIVALVGWQSDEIKRQILQVKTQTDHAERNQAAADLVDSANGNINRLRTVLKIIDDLLVGWNVLSDQARQGVIIDIRNQLATMTLLVLGWRTLAREKQLVIKDVEPISRE